MEKIDIFMAVLLCLEIVCLEIVVVMNAYSISKLKTQTFDTTQAVLSISNEKMARQEVTVYCDKGESFETTMGTLCGIMRVYWKGGFDG
jgi:hypothetical protein